MRMNSNKVHINQLVGKYLVRMVHMNNLIQYAYAGSTATSINIVIDLYSIKNSVLGVDFDANGYDFCSAILDMVVHYKNYFRGLRVDPYFILIDSNNRPARNIQLCPNYNSSFAIKTTSANYAGIKANLEVLSQVCNYLPDVNYIHTEDEAAVALAFLLEQFDTETPTMIISRDMYMGLLFDLPYNITLLYPSKYNGVDKSWIITPRNARNVIFSKVYGSSQEERLNMMPMSLIFAATKFPARDLAPILQYRTLVSKVTDIPNMPWNTNIANSMMPGITSRHMILDIPLQLESYRLTAESRLIKNAPPKLYDTEGLKLINNDLFAGTLQLDDLLR